MGTKIRSAGISFSITVLLAAVVITAGMWPGATAAETTINIDDLLTETQKGSPRADEMTVVWWIPNEFWEATMQDDPDITKGELALFLRMVNDYTVVAVVDGTLDSEGTVTYKKESEIRACLSIIDPTGVTYRPIAQKALPEDTKELFDVMRPALVEVIGKMGKNMQFYVFPGKNKGGERLLDPKKEGKFSIKLCNREFKWRLPIGSLLPAKTCSKCGEKLSGAFNFCPWDGTSLAGAAK